MSGQVNFHSTFAGFPPLITTSNPPQLENFVDFTNSETLKKYIDPAFQSPKDLSIAKQIVSTIYESFPRGIGNASKYGFAFSMHPEVLAYAMQCAPNKIVVEIAGARGENAILLAFAGAQKVYMNDIEPTEISFFRETVNSLPSNVKSKLESIEGSWLDLLGLKPELTGEVGIIVCRNLIHFFNDKEMSDFFKILKKLLKPGGIAIFTANSPYKDSQLKELFEQTVNTTSFEHTQCLVYDENDALIPQQVLLSHYSPCKEGCVSFSYQARDLYVRNKETHHKWQACTGNFKQLSPHLQIPIKKIIKENETTIKHIQKGRVRVLTNTYRMFSTATLKNLFVNEGFEVVESFNLTMEGHLFLGDDPYQGALSTGIIVKYSREV